MKIKLLFVLSFMAFFAAAQTERYIYETSVNPDTINLVDMSLEKTYLDIKGKNSVFVSENKLLKDSLNKNFKPEATLTKTKKSNKNKPELPKLPNGKTLKPTHFEYVIFKNQPNANVVLMENVGPKQIYYEEDRKIQWQILPDFATINGAKVQKATTEFGGRLWTAWFSEDIKISDGPYKFSGLPGLIIKLEDDRGDYKFIFEKKMNLPNAFEEKLDADARKSTRRNFNGDKAAINLELARNRTIDRSQMDMNAPNGGRNGGMPPGGMNGGMPPGNGMGGPPDASGRPANSEIKNISGQNNSFSNTIELK